MTQFTAGNWHSLKQYVLSYLYDYLLLMIEVLLCWSPRLVKCTVSVKCAHTVRFQSRRFLKFAIKKPNKQKTNLVELLCEGMTIVETIFSGQAVMYSPS